MFVTCILNYKWRLFYYRLLFGLNIHTHWYYDMSVICFDFLSNTFSINQPYCLHSGWCWLIHMGFAVPLCWIHPPYFVYWPKVRTFRNSMGWIPRLKRKNIYFTFRYIRNEYKYIHRDLFYEFTINESLICCTCSCSICSLSKVCTTIAVLRLGVSSRYFNKSLSRGTTFCSARLYQLSEQGWYKFENKWVKPLQNIRTNK